MKPDFLLTEPEAERTILKSRCGLSATALGKRWFVGDPV